MKEDGWRQLADEFLASSGDGVKREWQQLKMYVVWMDLLSRNAVNASSVTGRRGSCRRR